MNAPAAGSHAAIVASRRVVVKVGSSSITRPEGGLELDRLRALTAVIAERWVAGCQVTLVSSGAIAAGLAPLRLRKRPTDLATQQAAASAGQGSLMAAYTEAFAAYDLPVGQVLLTSDDMTRRKHYVNARRTLERLFDLRVVPIVNENDTVATEEIRFGDNDRLAALVAHLVAADALILLSDVDALYTAPPTRPGSVRIPVVAAPGDLDGVDVTAAGSHVGTGGMVTKVSAANLAAAEGIPTLITSAALAAEALSGSDVGTLFTPTGSGNRARQRWLAHVSASSGRLMLDDGAVAAIVTRRTSLLPVGVTRVEGTFLAGDTVDLCGLDGTVVARGRVAYDAAELVPLMGRSSAADGMRLDRTPGSRRRTVVRRDDLVVL